MAGLRPVRVAVEGCGHGTLHAIYASIAESARVRGWDTGVDLVIIGGDFQAVRNAADLTVMSCPAKYRQIGDFADYYSGRRVAPYLTMFIGGNHEAASHLGELFYGGWVAPRMYYLGAAGVVRLQGGLRIAGLSGIWKGFDYNKPHLERLPFNADDVKTFYHVREVDVRRLLMLRSQVDIGLSHDWPRGIELLGNSRKLFRDKPLFEQDSISGKLGSAAAEWVMDRLRPPHWFSAHLHCKFAAIKTYGPDGAAETVGTGQASHARDDNPDEINLDGEDETAAPAPAVNPDMIDLDDADDEPTLPVEAQAPTANPDQIDLDNGDDESNDIQDSTRPHQPPNPTTSSQQKQSEANPHVNGVTDELRAQLPAAFARSQHSKTQRLNPGQPTPAGVTNTNVRFLALDKCLPGRHFIQLLEVTPLNPESVPPSTSTTSPPPPDTPSSPTPPTDSSFPLRLEYDPEWLAITRALSPIVLTRPGDPHARVPAGRGEAYYAPLVDEARAWVEDHVVKTGKLLIPENFEPTAPAYVPGEPEQVPEQPVEWTNPQTAAFCDLLGLENLWDAPEEEREDRRRNGAVGGAVVGGLAGGGGGGGGGRGHWNSHRGGGRGRGGGGRGGGGGGGYRGRGRGGGGGGGWRGH